MRARTRFQGRLARGLASWLAAGVLLLPVAARGWWNDEWKGRKQLTIDTSAAGGNVTQPIGAAAVLVRLHVGNFKFEAAKENGSDLRFVAADDKTPLKHQLEKWDPLLGEALIWVGVPEIKPGARTELWLYFGNPKAAPAGASRREHLGQPRGRRRGPVGGGGAHRARHQARRDHWGDDSGGAVAHLERGLARHLVCLDSPRRGERDRRHREPRGRARPLRRRPRRREAVRRGGRSGR